MFLNVKAFATGFWLAAILAGAWAWSGKPAAAQDQGGSFPLFRHIDSAAPPPDLKAIGSVRLLADDDFPPFSFRDRQGATAGITVDLARAVCADLELACEVVARPWRELTPALLRGDGDAIISGARVTPGLPDALDATRPFYRALARFAVHAGTPIAGPSSRALAGKRVGAIEGSGHAAFIERYFPQSRLVLFASERDAREALRLGQIDALFADAIGLIYWVAGAGSQGCCALLPGTFVDRRYFSHGLSFILRRQDEALRAALDYGLDRAQGSGASAAAFRRYVPQSPW